jgi:hypothetical protein
MTKPGLQLVADFGFSDEELIELKDVCETIFDVEIMRYHELSTEVLEPIIIFVFLEVTSGFLKAIGKEIWNKIKKKILKVVIQNKDGHSELEFRVKKGDTKIRFKFMTTNPNLMEEAIDKFPEALESAEEFEEEYVEFDSEKEEWEI